VQRINELHLKINKLGKTQYFSNKVCSGDLTEETKPTFEDIEEDSRPEVEFIKMDKIRLEQKQSNGQFKRGDRMKSFKAIDFDEKQKSSNGNEERVQIDSSTKSIDKYMTNEDHAKVNYRKQRMNRNYKFDITWAPLKKAKSYNDSTITHWSNRGEKKIITILRDTSPSDVTQNMKQVNHERYGSK